MGTEIIEKGSHLLTPFWSLMFLHLNFKKKMFYTNITSVSKGTQIPVNFHTPSEHVYATSTYTKEQNIPQVPEASLRPPFSHAPPLRVTILLVSTILSRLELFINGIIRYVPFRI